MQILALRSYTSGYRGCLIDSASYLFFQLTRKAGYKELKSYPRSEFQDYLHFIAMMQKFMSPAAFIVPPVPIETLTLETLDRVHAQVQAARKAAHP